MVIDISSNNGIIDFKTLAQQGVDELFIRLTMGYGTQDKLSKSNAQGATENGIPISFYHFVYAHSDIDPIEDSTKQANYFVQILNTMPVYQRLAIDCEPEDASGTDTKYTQEQYSQWLANFLYVVKASTGHDMIIYTYTDYLNKHLPSNHKFGAYDLWIAQYKNESQPTLPKGWNTWELWQYTEKGQVLGIDGMVDISKTNS
jgi:GH25 family lysozyme M1 (1,4-beta-N-acetylmuramidase)